MNIEKIYNSFYDEHGSESEDRVNVIRDAFMEQIKRLGITDTAYLTIEASLSALLGTQEEEAFKDGFCVGVNHITQAMAFANARLAR